jgi:hypothetical protein
MIGRTDATDAWNASILADSEEIDTLNDSTLETIRTTERK